MLINLCMGYLIFGLKRSNTKLKKMSGIDYLTELFNRRRFYENFLPEWEEAMEKNRIAHLIIIDLDNFKRINDSYGHDAGDRALKMVSKILKRNISSGCIGRFGGDEFLVGITGISTDEVLSIGEKIRKDVRGLEISVEDRNLTTSIGIISTIPKKNELRDYIKSVDELLYKSKKNGKNRIYHNFI